MNTGTGWALIIAGVILAIIFGIIYYEAVGPGLLIQFAYYIFWLGIALLIIGIVVIVISLLRRATKT